MITAFCNGCFDLIHVGHIRLLQYAKRQAWILSESEDENGLLNNARLVVAINSDESVRRLKGNNKPIQSQQDRKEILESIKWVDEVIIFDEDSPRKLIKELRPSFIVKGPDYMSKEYDGIYVAIYPGSKDKSTSEIIERIRQNDYDLR